MQSTAKILAGAAGLTTAFVAGGFAKNKFNQVNIDNFHKKTVIVDFLSLFTFIIIIMFNQVNIDHFCTACSWFWALY